MSMRWRLSVSMRWRLSVSMHEVEVECIHEVEVEHNHEVEVEHIHEVEVECILQEVEAAAWPSVETEGKIAEVKCVYINMIYKLMTIKNRCS